MSVSQVHQRFQFQIIWFQSSYWQPYDGFDHHEYCNPQDKDDWIFIITNYIVQCPLFRTWLLRFMEQMSIIIIIIIIIVIIIIIAFISTIAIIRHANSGEYSISVNLVSFWQSLKDWIIFSTHTNFCWTSINQPSIGAERLWSWCQLSFGKVCKLLLNLESALLQNNFRHFRK